MDLLKRHLRQWWDLRESLSADCRKLNIGSGDKSKWCDELWHRCEPLRTFCSLIFNWKQIEYTDSDVALVNKANDFAVGCHMGQIRKYDGLPYITHPVRVAEYTKLYKCPAHMTAAAFLHDVIEDCGVTKAKLAEKFGSQVADLVDDLTDKATHMKELNRAGRKRLEYERLAKCGMETKVLKLIDRIDNLMDMQHVNDDFIPVYIKESKDLLRYIGRPPGRDLPAFGEPIPPINQLDYTYEDLTNLFRLQIWILQSGQPNLVL